HGIAGHKDGSVWVADTGHQRIVKLYFDGYEMSYTGIVIEGLNQPWGVELDKDGNVYITDKGNNRVLKYNPDGNPLSDFDGNNYLNYNLSQPLDLAINSTGNIIVVDSTDRLSIFHPDGRFVKSIRISQIGFANGQLVSVDVDRYDNIYLLEKNNRYVIKLDKELNFLDYFGGAGQGDLKFEEGVNSLTVFGQRGGIGVCTEYGAKLFRIGPGLHDTTLDQSTYSPYGPDLKISYKTTSECSIEVIVLDANSDFVRKLQSSEFQDTGEHIVYWDGKNEMGNHTSEGHYYVKIVAYTAVETPFGQEIELPFDVSYSASLNLISTSPDTITTDSIDSTLKYELTKDGKPIIDLVKPKINPETNKLY
ncbi:MAG: hypothetical protein KAT05_13835, partial [Spirochaetes bacterium]|nr:hypothetical protein [Spirochaetota bacterium]